MDDEERGPKQVIAIAKCFPHEWNAANLRVFCMNATRGSSKCFSFECHAAKLQNVFFMNATRQIC